MATAAPLSFRSIRTFLSRPPPVIKASLTSGSIMMLGDILTQQLTAPKDQPRRLDLQRTARFGLVGATLHGPYFFFGLRAIDGRFGPGKTLRNAIVKTATAQVVLFPPFLTLLFGWVGLLEGRTPKQCVQKIKDNFWPAFTVGCIFWPTANLINFRFVSTQRRVLYVSCAALIWNSYLSWVNSQKGFPPRAALEENE